VSTLFGNLGPGRAGTVFRLDPYLSRQWVRHFAVRKLPNPVKSLIDVTDWLPEMLLSTVLSRLKIELYTSDEYLRIHLKTYVISSETFFNIAKL